MRFLESLPPGGTGRSRFLALSLLGLSLLLIGRGIVLPIAHAFGDGGPLARQRIERDGYRRLAARRDELTRDLAALTQKKNDKGDFLPGTTPSVAEADLQTHLAILLREAGGILTGSERLPATKDGKFSRVGVQLRVTAGHIALRSILHRIESDRPRLQVESMNIQRGAKTDDLSVTLNVTGYLAVSP